jgi:predicted ATPase/DNA-binding winged helix-turn-helix (wHTH) protein
MTFNDRIPGEMERQQSEAGKIAAASCPGHETALLFGPFVLYKTRKLLLEGDRPVRLGSRALDLLIALIEGAGQVLSREQLEARVWPTTVVEETSLRVHVSALRKALGEGQAGARYIANVPGRGYSFVMNVVPGAASPPSADGVTEHGQEHAQRRWPDRTAPGRLPVRLMRAIGRAGVTRELGAQLALRRLVTVVGPGGIGKTTVALAVAEQSRGRFEHGACFADLAPLADPALVPAALAAALGIEVPAEGPIAALCAFLAERHVLIVLDNCEHVVDAAASLAERLLRATRSVHILATSREPLYAQSEWVHHLPALDAPIPSAQLTPEQALEFPAIELFVERAMANDGGFALTAASLPAVCYLCRQLDGMPLAIELAAARIDSLGAEGLAARLGDVFGLLTRGRRNALPRHRTLEALLDWSYDLLTDTERVVIRRMSVFRAGFTVDAAVAVCTCERICAAMVVDSLMTLAAKSLLALDLDGHPVQYRLLHITRTYTERKLANSGEAGTLAARHAVYVRDLLERADADLKALPIQRWISIHGRNTDDLRAALDWAFSSEGDTELGLLLTSRALYPVYELGLHEEYRARLHVALGRMAALPQPRPQLEMTLLCSLALLGGQTTVSEPEQAEVFARLRALMCQVDSHAHSVQALYSMCVGSFGQGDYPAVVGLAGELAELSASASDQLGLLLADRFLALGLHYLGQHERARVLAQRVVELPLTQRHMHLFGPVPRAVSMGIVLARVAWLDGHPDQAASIAGEALACAEGEHPLALCQVLGMASIPIALWRGEHAAAGVLAVRLLEHAGHYCLGYWQAWARGYLAVLARRRGAADDAGGATASSWYLPANAVELDTLGTLDESLVDAASVARVDAGTVLWCGPEILRAHGENLLRLHPADGALAAEPLFLRALTMARNQRALAWQLRSALSLARLWSNRGRAAEGRALLAEVVLQFGEGHDTADLVAAHALLRRLYEQLHEQPARHRAAQHA